MSAGLPPILMTTDTIGGVWTYTVDLCRELAGCDIALASMGEAPRRDQRSEIAGLPHVQLFESGYALEWMPDPWHDVDRAGAWLLALAERTGAGLVHLNQFSHGALPWRVPCLVVGHSCVYSWFYAVRGHAPTEEWRRYYAAVRRGLLGADRVSAPSRWMIEELKRLYGRFNAAAPIYNGRRAPRSAARPKENLILTAGRLWDPAKNIAGLAEAAAGVPWPIYAAGDTTGPASSTAEMSRLHHLGRLSAGELCDWLARAAIFALPARYEPFGLSILEAALAGCALVLGDLPSLREIWRDDARFVRPGDPQALAAALRELIAVPALRAELAQRARRRAREFTPARMGQAYLTLYRDMRAARAPRAGGVTERRAQA